MAITRRSQQSPSSLSVFSDTEQDNEMENDATQTPTNSGKNVISVQQQSSSSPLTPLQNVVLAMRKRLEQQLGQPRSGGERRQTPRQEHNQGEGHQGVGHQGEGHQGAGHQGAGYQEAGHQGAEYQGAETPDGWRRDREEEGGGEKVVSPSLARLRMTPGRKLRDKQRALERLHERSKSRAAHLSVGGGISLWPEMTDMRLTTSHVIYLTMAAIGLLGAVVVVFNKIHGELFRNLVRYNREVKAFHDSHPIQFSMDNETFRTSVLNWHQDFTQLIEDIDDKFSVSGWSLQYKLCVLLYILCIAVLLYYLADNILAKSKLTPRRIKVWVLLLVITGGWTLLLLQLLVLAQTLEATMEDNVHTLSQLLGDLVFTDLDLTVYHNVLVVWRTRCLPPTSRGLLSILGLVAVKDVAYYLQYYSLPVLTALLTPVVKLIFAVREIYSTPEKVQKLPGKDLG